MKYDLRPNYVGIKQKNIKTKNLKNFWNIFGELFIGKVFTN